MKFESIFGQAETKAKLIAQVKNNRISHAQIFASKEGSNALALAIAFAQFINCTNKLENDSCGTCASCSKYEQMAHPDLHFSFPFIADASKKLEIADDFIVQFRQEFIENPMMNLYDWTLKLKAENKKPNITIKECRNIIKKLSLKAYESEYKVLIMWLPEYLGNEGNVLLKSLEEPPQKTLFLLVSEDQNNILPTILSRTQMTKIPRYSREDVMDFLMKQQGLEEQISKNISLMSEGNLNKAIKLSEQINNSMLMGFKEFLNNCFKNNFSELEKWASSFKESGKNEAKNFLNYALEIIRLSAIVEFKSVSQLVDAEEERVILSLSRLMDLSNREHVYKAFNKAFYEIERNGNLKLILIDLSLTLRNNFKREPKVVSKQ